MVIRVVYPPVELWVGLQCAIVTLPGHAQLRIARNVKSSFSFLFFF